MIGAEKFVSKLFNRNILQKPNTSSYTIDARFVKQENVAWFHETFPDHEASITATYSKVLFDGPF